MTEPSRGKVFFSNLDGLRFLAFFLVFLNHTLALRSLKKMAEMHPALNRSVGGALQWGVFKVVFAAGWAGVSFFFVLSGFLITYLLLYEIEVTGHLDVLAFYIRRALRIWPLYYLLFLLGFVVLPLIGIPGTTAHGSPFSYLLFLENFEVIRMGGQKATEAWVTTIAWSVAIEEQFYLLWPLLFFLTPRRGHKFLFPLVILGSTIFRGVYGGKTGVLYYHTLSVISDMGMGGLAAYLALRSKAFGRALEGLPRVVILAGYLVGLFGMSLGVEVAESTFLRLAVTLFFAFVVLEQNFCRRSFFKMGSFPTLSFLGQRTYGFYMLHVLLAQITAWYVGRFIGSTDAIAPRLLYVAVSLGLTLGAGLLSYRFFEARFLTLKRHFAHIASSAPTPTS